MNRKTNKKYMKNNVFREELPDHSWFVNHTERCASNFNMVNVWPRYLD